MKTSALALFATFALGAAAFAQGTTQEPTSNAPTATADPTSDVLVYAPAQPDTNTDAYDLSTIFTDPTGTNPTDTDITDPTEPPNPNTPNTINVYLLWFTVLINPL